jgi:hypothetical protein
MRRVGGRSALMIYLPGGPSHLDMYDLKPSAPAEFRGEFRPIRTNVPGVDICEFFSRQAQMWDKLADIRSIVAGDERSDSEIMTGYSEATNRQAHHPSLGAVASKLCGPAREGIPPFVNLRGLTIGLGPGYLGISHRAFAPSGPGYRNLQLAPEVTVSRLEERKDLLTRFDSLRRDLDVPAQVLMRRVPLVPLRADSRQLGCPEGTILSRLGGRVGHIDRGVADRNPERRWLPRRPLAHVE